MAPSMAGAQVMSSSTTRRRSRSALPAKLPIVQRILRGLYASTVSTPESVVEFVWRPNPQKSLQG
jgi:hypothetical protein